MPDCCESAVIRLLGYSLSNIIAVKIMVSPNHSVVLSGLLSGMVLLAGSGSFLSDHKDSENTVERGKAYLTNVGELVGILKAERLLDGGI